MEKSFEEEEIVRELQARLAKYNERAKCGKEFLELIYKFIVSDDAKGFNVGSIKKDETGSLTFLLFGMRVKTIAIINLKTSDSWIVYQLIDKDAFIKKAKNPDTDKESDDAKKDVKDATLEIKRFAFTSSGSIEPSSENNAIIHQMKIVADYIYDRADLPLVPNAEKPSIGFQKG